MIGHKVANRRAGAFQFSVLREMHHQHIEFFFVGLRIGAESLVTGYVVFEGIFDIGSVPCLGFGLINQIKQVDGKVLESGLVEALGKGLPNEGIRLVAVNLASKR